MIRFDKNEIIDKLCLTPNGSAGWYSNKDDVCPYCNKGGKKWGLIFDQYGNGVFHCFKCGTKTTLKNYLLKIGRKDLIKYGYEAETVKSKLTPLISEKTEEDDNLPTKCKLPRKLQYLKSNEYLDKRGFKPRYYEEFKPAITDFFLEKSLKDKFIFQFTMNGKIVAWLARSKKSKEWHEENLRNFKEHKDKLVLRYQNSEDGFRKVIGGYDNITDKTDTLIIVEGLFDYISVDDKLYLYESDEIKCIFTFGNNIGNEQIKFLRKKQGVKNIILMYDPDKPEQIKTTALTLQRFYNVKIALLKDKKKDPGDATQEELLETFDNLIDPIDYFLKVLK